MISQSLEGWILALVREATYFATPAVALSCPWYHCAYEDEARILFRSPEDDKYRLTLQIVKFNGIAWSKSIQS
jgi:hypothetical protein